MSEWTLILAFCAGLIPTAAFSMCVVTLLHSWCTALKGELDAWKRTCGELERRHAGVMSVEGSKIPLEPTLARADAGLPPPSGGRAELDEALVWQMAHAAQLEEELAQLRQEHQKVQAVLAQEKERIGRVVGDLNLIRAEWSNHRREFAEAPADRRSA